MRILAQSPEASLQKKQSIAYVTTVPWIELTTNGISFTLKRLSFPKSMMIITNADDHCNSRRNSGAAYARPVEDNGHQPISRGPAPAVEHANAMDRLNDNGGKNVTTKKLRM